MKTLHKSLFFLFLLSLYFCIDAFAQVPYYVNWSSKRQDQLFEEKNAIGNMANDFTVVDMKGDSIRLSDLRGKVVFINFFFVECYYCMVEVPMLNGLTEKFKDKDVVFLGIATSSTKEKIQTMLEKHKWDFTLYPAYDYTKTEQSFSSSNRYIATMLYYTNAFPANIIIDKEGKIRHRVVGYDAKRDDGKIFSEVIENALKE